ncbi:unnamed protein product [Spirodela intermedia]|uniref:Uncharacterized protein n=1 Tax=Spirodela intermedia TaxID=51605 RepID=A0A7I8L1Y9_SPIIN|nr:unnamed protein product [Spirodela intermedia]
MKPIRLGRVRTTPDQISWTQAGWGGAVRSDPGRVKI